jgi:hypothetical protein
MTVESNQHDIVSGESFLFAVGKWKSGAMNLTIEIYEHDLSV